MIASEVTPITNRSCTSDRVSNDCPIMHSLDSLGHLQGSCRTQAVSLDRRAAGRWPRSPAGVPVEVGFQSLVFTRDSKIAKATIRSIEEQSFYLRSVELNYDSISRTRAEVSLQST